MVSDTSQTNFSDHTTIDNHEMCAAERMTLLARRRLLLSNKAREIPSVTTARPRLTWLMLSDRLRKSDQKL